MPGPLLQLLAAAAFAALIGTTAANAGGDADRGMGRSDDPIARAQSETEWPLHTALEGERRPFLCKTRDSVDLIVGIMAQAFDFQDKDADKGKRILEIASRLQGELCTRPAKDDIVILRCKIDQQEFPGITLSTVRSTAELLTWRATNGNCGELPTNVPMIHATMTTAMTFTAAPPSESA